MLITLVSQQASRVAYLSALATAARLTLPTSTTACFLPRLPPQQSPRFSTATTRNMASTWSGEKVHADASPSELETDPRMVAAKYFPEFDVQKRVIIVTGGGRGLGLAMAEALFQGGAIVHCFDRLPEPDQEFVKVQKLDDRIPGGHLHYHCIDITDTQSLQKLMAEIAEQYSRLDGVIAAAGIQQVTPALEYQKKDIEEMLDVNYTAAFMTAQEAGKQMIRFKTPGSIAVVASISGQIANRGLFSPIYNSSKAAVIQLTKNLAMEWGGHGIRVNALCPGHILTPMVRANFQDQPELEPIWRKEIMLGRLSNPEEFRGPAIFLMSKASSFMTGSMLNVDGGQTAW